ncbi:MAG: aspartate carbamoyltransferase regulatory subunit [Oscillospiraceae bacterium]|nr:aspartate carbamoyltransferase regulatory subunit [Oscillospiraceae bacterium]
MDKQFVNPIDKGIVIDHIRQGLGIKLYHHLGLNNVDFTVAIVTNAASNRCGRKDIIKIQNNIALDYAVIGLIDANATVNIIEGGRVVNKERMSLPQKVENAIKCKNPRCVTAAERGVVHTFTLCDEQAGLYRCVYCEERASGM